jgi:hypothetical protein
MAKQTNLQLGTDGFSVPIEAITNTFAIFGVRGSGKSNVATVFAEGIVRAGQPMPTSCASTGCRFWEKQRGRSSQSCATGIPLANRS